MTLLTIIEAAMITNRKKSAIYAWIADGRLASVIDIDGVRKVDGKALMAVEASIRRGRPKGTATPGATRRRTG